MGGKYQLGQSIEFVKGVGPKLAEKLSQQGISTVRDLLLWLPLRYEDRSTIVTIADLKPLLNQPQLSSEFVTTIATVLQASNYYKGRRSIQRAKIQDATGTMTAMWFNNRFILNKLVRGSEYRFSGKLGKNNTLLQPSVEAVASDTVHTGRLVPIYSASLGFKVGTIRRILKEVVDNLVDDQGWAEIFTQLHFPDEQDKVVEARERLALEEVLALIHRSHHIKKEWNQYQTLGQITISEKLTKLAQEELPFFLTAAQEKALQQICSDLAKNSPMNRLLIGDVGSGKTVVAAIAGLQVLNNNHNVALIAPTQILAQQHWQTFSQIAPQAKTSLVTANTKPKSLSGTQATLYIGTHALINQLPKLKPALTIYDEQHRFGVKQRTAAYPQSTSAKIRPHVLTMSATPIPRSLMLTIFSHLSLSVIDELPAGRKPKKTWLVSRAKRTDSYLWLAKQVAQDQATAIVVCPFINPSTNKSFENVASVAQVYEQLTKLYQADFPKLRLGFLHSQLTNNQKKQVSEQLFQNQLDVLVTTPIVEVGLDLPSASVIAIETAERFGLASLHQLRGRVGRAGQQAYCLVLTSTDNSQSNDRLSYFAQEQNGLKLAEFDLQKRGAGNIFGTTQHGFGELRFSSWANLELIAKARQEYENTSKNQTWTSPIFEADLKKTTTPGAN